MNIGFHIGIPTNIAGGGEIPPPNKTVYGLESSPSGIYALELGNGFYGSESNTLSSLENNQE